MTYMITAATYRKLKHFATEPLLQLLADEVVFCFRKFGRALQAYVVLPNHYHVLAISPDVGAPLVQTISAIHRYTAKELRSRTRAPRDAYGGTTGIRA